MSTRRVFGVVRSSKKQSSAVQPLVLAGYGFAGHARPNVDARVYDVAKEDQLPRQQVEYF